MGETFHGVRFPKQYMGKDYEGVVNAVRWIRGQGYVVNVLYSDGYKEILQLKELEKVLKQERIGAVRTFGSTASGPLRPKVEHCSGFHVAVGDHGEAVQLIGRAISQSTEEAVKKKLHSSNVGASAESVISQNALGQQPNFINISEPVAPFGVTLSDLTNMLMFDISNIRDDNSVNCDNSNPKGMHDDPLLSSTIHQQRRKTLDCNAFRSVPSARDNSETGNGRISAPSARYFNICDVLASIAEFTAELFLIGVMLNVQTLLAQIFILDRRFLQLWFFLRLGSYIDGS